MVDLAVGAGMAALVESHHSQETVQEESLAQVQGTNQAVVGHKASLESRPGLEDHHDPIRQVGPEGRNLVDIVGGARKEVRLGPKGHLVAEDQEGDLVVDAAERVGTEVEDVIRSICNWSASCPLTIIQRSNDVACKIRRKATEISTRFCALGEHNELTSEIFHHRRSISAESSALAQVFIGVSTLTPSIAGSFGTCGGMFSLAAGVSSILKSFTSLPRNTMYS